LLQRLPMAGRRNIVRQASGNSATALIRHHINQFISDRLE